MDQRTNSEAPEQAGSGRRCLSRQAIELSAERLRVIAEANRIALLEALNEGEAGVQELADRIGASHQNVSRHLGVLHQAGIVSRRREGAESRYALIDWTGWWVVEQIARSVAEALDEPPDSAE